MDNLTYNELAASRKVRIHADSRKEAKNLQEQYGGWIFTGDDGKVCWYSLKYTATEIMMDRKGGGVIS